MNQTKTVESRVAEALLQLPSGVVEVDGVEYTIDRPRIQTLVLIAAQISKLPQLGAELKVEQQLLQALCSAPAAAPILGRIAALLILGPKPQKEERIIRRRRCFGLISQQKMIVIDRSEELAEKLLFEWSPQQLQNLIVEALGNQQLPIFFGVITSLSEANLLKPTSEV